MVQMVAWDVIQKLLEDSSGYVQAVVDILLGTATAGWYGQLHIINLAISAVQTY